MESTLLNPSDNTEVECCILDHVSPKVSMAIVRNEDPFHQNPMLKNSQWLVSSWEKENSFRFCKRKQFFFLIFFSGIYTA